MKLNSNIEELINRLQSVAQQANTIDVSEPLVSGINAAMGAMKYRIFNEGKDRFGISLGEYVGEQSGLTSRKFTSVRSEIFDSETKRLLGKQSKRLKKNTQDLDPGGQYSEYEKLRLSHGRQIRYKDLEFTGSLRRSIIVAAESQTKVTCIINNKEDLQIAGFQEIQIGEIRKTGKADIFGMSNDERQVLIEVTNQALSEVYGRLFTTK